MPDPAGRGWQWGVEESGRGKEERTGRKGFKGRYMSVTPVQVLRRDIYKENDAITA